MKKNIIIASLFAGAFLTTMSCGNKKVDGPNPDADSTEVKVDVEKGQTVLTPSYYQEYLQEDKDLSKRTYVFYSAEVTEPGVGSTKVDHIGKEYDVPNALIIPLPSDATAKVGDILLTWWQSGSGLKRAIVTDASDPKAPTVSYLDLSWSIKNGDVKKFKEDEKIKPGTFRVLKEGEWAPGMQVAYEEEGQKKAGYIISLTDDKVLISGFAGHIYVAKRSDCKLISLKPSFKPGDKVFGVYVDSYEDKFTVKKFDKKNGRVWLEDNRNTTCIKNILEVSNNL